MSPNEIQFELSKHFPHVEIEQLAPQVTMFRCTEHGVQAYKRGHKITTFAVDSLVDTVDPHRLAQLIPDGLERYENSTNHTYEGTVNMPAFFNGYELIRIGISKA